MTSLETILKNMHRLNPLALTLGACGLLAVLATPVLADNRASANTQVSPLDFVNQFEATFGKFEGYRRSGAKGVCAVGEFVGNADGRAVSSASAFSGQKIPVTVRFSVGGANPKAPDNGKSQRNLSLQFDLPNGEVWQHGNINAPVFGAANPQQFLGRVASLQPDPTTKAADPAKVKAFADANPEVLLQGRYFASQPVPASFASINYWGVHGFIFTNAAGQKTAGKWIFEPVGGVQGLSDEQAKEKGANFLFDDLRQRVASGQAAFNFNLEVAQPGDKLDNATVPLPEGRRKITLGQLKITSVSTDADGACLTINFDPNRMPKGAEGAGDPMLTARSAPYAVGLGRRLVEGAKQQ